MNTRQLLPISTQARQNAEFAMLRPKLATTFATTTIVIHGHPKQHRFTSEGSTLAVTIVVPVTGVLLCGPSRGS